VYNIDVMDSETAFGTDRTFLYDFLARKLVNLNLLFMQNSYAFVYTINKWFVLLTQYCAGDKIEKNEIGWTCGAYG